MRRWEHLPRSSASAWHPPGCLQYFYGIFILVALVRFCCVTGDEVENFFRGKLNTTAGLGIEIAVPATLNASVLVDVAEANQAILDETGYGHQRKRDTVDEPASRWPLIDFLESRTPPPPVRLADLAIIAPTTELVFHANESMSHVRTDAWLLPYDTCLEARFRLEGKRTRLLIYTCQMTEDGECKLDKFTATNADVAYGRPTRNQNVVVTVGRTFGSLDVERCVQLRPWIFHRTPFAFHFKFVRRPRRFSDPLVEERHRRRRRLGKRATREVGHVTLKGFKNCTSTCKRDADRDRWLDDGSIHESNFELAHYNPSKRRRRRRRLHVHRN